MSKIHSSIEDLLRALVKCPLVVPISAAGYNGMPSNVKPTNTKSGKDNIASKPSKPSRPSRPTYHPDTGGSATAEQEKKKAEEKKKREQKKREEEARRQEQAAKRAEAQRQAELQRQREEQERQARLQEQQAKQAEAQRQAAERQAKAALQAQRDAAEKQRIANEKAQAAAKAQPNATVNINGQTKAAGGYATAQQEQKKAGAIKDDKGGLYEAQTAMANAATAKRVAAGETAAASTFLGNAVNAERNALSGYADYNIKNYSTTGLGHGGALIAEQEMKKAGALNTASISEKQAFVDAIQRIYNRYGSDIEAGKESAVKAAEEAVLRAEHIILKGKSWDLYKEKESVADYVNARNLTSAEDLKTAQALFDAQNLQRYKDDPEWAAERVIKNGKVVWTGRATELANDGAHTLLPFGGSGLFDSYTRKFAQRRNLAPQVGKALGLSDADVTKIMTRDVQNDDFEYLMSACIAHDCTPDQFLANKEWLTAHPGASYKDMAHTSVRLATTSDLAEIQKDNTPYVQIFLENSNRWKYTAADKNMYIGNQMLNTNYTGLAYYNTATGEIVRIACDSDKSQAYKNTEAKAQACQTIADFNANKYAAAANKIDRLTKGYGLVESAIEYTLLHSDKPAEAIKELIMANKMYESHADELDKLVVEVQESFEKYCDYEDRAYQYKKDLERTNIVYASKEYEERMQDAYTQSQLANAAGKHASESGLSFGDRTEANSAVDVLGEIVWGAKKILTNIGSQNLTAFASGLTDGAPGPYDDMFNEYFTNVGQATVEWLDNSAILALPRIIDEMRKDAMLDERTFRASNLWTYTKAFLLSPALREMAEWGDLANNVVGLKTRLVSYNAYLHRGALADNEYTQYLTGELDMNTASFKQIYDATYTYMNGNADNGARASVDWSDACYEGQLSTGMSFVANIIADIICDPQTYLTGGLTSLFGMEGLKGIGKKYVADTASRRLSQVIIEDTLAAGKRVDAVYVEDLEKQFNLALKHSKGSVAEMFEEANSNAAVKLATKNLVNSLEQNSASDMKLAKELSIKESGAAVKSMTQHMDDLEKMLKAGAGLTGKEAILYNAAATTVNVFEVAEKIDALGIYLSAWPLKAGVEVFKATKYASEWIRTMSPKLAKLEGQQGTLALSRKLSQLVTVLSEGRKADEVAEALTDAASTEMKALTAVDPKGAAKFQDCILDAYDSYKTGSAIDAVREVLDADKRALELYDVKDPAQHALKLQALSGTSNRLQGALDNCEKGIKTVRRDKERMELVQLRRDIFVHMAEADKELSTDMLKLYEQLNKGVKAMRAAFSEKQLANVYQAREQIMDVVRKAQHEAQALHQVLGEHNVHFEVQGMIDVLDDYSNLADEFAHVFNPIMIDETEAVAHYILALDETSEALEDVTRIFETNLNYALNVLNNGAPKLDNFRNHKLFTTSVFDKELTKSDVAERLAQKIVDAKGESCKSIRGLEGRINASLKTSLSQVNLRDAENIYMFSNTPQATVRTFLNSYEAEEIVDAMHGYGTLANNFSVITATDPDLGVRLGKKFGALSVSKPFYDMASDSEYMEHILGAYQNSNVERMFRRMHNTGNSPDCIEEIVDDIMAKANNQIAKGKQIDTNHWEFGCNTPDVEKNVDNMIAVLSEKLGEPAEDTIRIFFSIDNKSGIHDVPNAYCFKVQNGPSITHYTDNFKNIIFDGRKQFKAHNMSLSDYGEYIHGMDITTVSEKKMNLDIYDYLTGILSDEANKGKHIEFVGFNSRTGATAQADTLRNYLGRINAPVHFDGIIDGSEFFHDVGFLSDAEGNAIRSALNNAFLEYETLCQKYGGASAIVRTDTQWTPLKYSNTKAVNDLLRTDGKLNALAEQALNAINTKGLLMYDEVGQNLANNTGSLSHLMIDKHELQEALSWFYDKPINLNMREFIDTVFGENSSIGISTVRNKYLHEFWGDIDQNLMDKIADVVQYERLFMKADEVYSACGWMRGVQRANFKEFVDDATRDGLSRYIQGIIDSCSLNPKESSQALALTVMVNNAADMKSLDRLMSTLKVAEGMRKCGVETLKEAFTNSAMSKLTKEQIFGAYGTEISEYLGCLADRLDDIRNVDTHNMTERLLKIAHKAYKEEDPNIINILKALEGLANEPAHIALTPYSNMVDEFAGNTGSALLDLYNKMFDTNLRSFSYADQNMPLLSKIEQSISGYELFGQVEDVLAHTGMDYLTMRHMQEEISGVTDLVNRRAATAISAAREQLMAIRDYAYSGVTAIKEGDDVLKQLDDAEAIYRAKQKIKNMGLDNVQQNIRLIEDMTDDEFLAYMVNNAKGIAVVQSNSANKWMRDIKGLNVQQFSDEAFVCWLDFGQYTGAELDKIMSKGTVIRTAVGANKFGDFMNWMQNNVLGASYGFSNGHRMHAEYLEGLYDTFNIPKTARFNSSLYSRAFNDAYDCSVIGDPEFLRRYNSFAASNVLDVAAQGLRMGNEHIDAANDLVGYALSKANNMKYNMDRFSLNYKALEEEGIKAYTLKLDKNGLPKAQVINWKLAEKIPEKCWLLDEFTVQALGDQVYGLKVAASPEFVQGILRALDRWKMASRQLNIIGMLYGGSFLPASAMRNWRDAVPKAAYYDNSGTFFSYLADAPTRQIKYEETLRDIIASGATIDEAGIAGYFRAMGNNAVMTEKAFREMHSISALGSSTIGDILADNLKAANDALAEELGLSQDIVNAALKKINAHIVKLNKKGLPEDVGAFYDTLNKNERLVYENFVRTGGYQNKLADLIGKLPWIKLNAQEFSRVEDVVRGALRNMYLDAGYSTLKTEHLVNMSQYNYASTGHIKDWFPFIQFKLCNTKTWASDLVHSNPRAIYNRAYIAREAGYAYQEEQYTDLFNMIGYRDVMLANPDKYINNPDEDAQTWYNQYLEYVNNFNGVNKLYGAGIPLGNNHFIKDGDSFSTMPQYLVEVVDLFWSVFARDGEHIWDGLANVTYEPIITALHAIKDGFSELPALMREMNGKSFTEICSLVAGRVKNSSLDDVETAISMIPFLNTLYSTVKRDWKYGVLNVKALAAMGTESIETVREAQGSGFEYILGVFSGIVGTYRVDEKGYKDLYSWMQKNPATYVDWYKMCTKMGLSGEDVNWFLDSVFGDDRPQTLMYDMSFLHDTLLYLTERGYTPDEIDELLTDRKSWLWTRGTDAMAARDVLELSKKILDDEIYNQLPKYIKYSGDFKDILDFYVEELGYDYRHAKLAMLEQHPYIDPEGNVRMMSDQAFKKYLEYEGWVMAKYEDQIPKGISYSNGDYSVDHSIYAVMKREGLSFEDALKYCIENNVWWSSNSNALLPLQQSYVDRLNEINQANFDAWWGKLNKYVKYTPGVYRQTADRMKLLGLSTEAMRKAMELGIYYDKAGDTFRQAGSMEGMYYDKKTGQWKQWIDYKKMWDLGWYYKNGEWHQRWSGGGRGWLDYKALYAEMWEKGYYWKNGEWHKWRNYGGGHRRHWVTFKRREGWYFKNGQWHKWIDYSKRWRKGYGEYGYYKPQKPKSTKIPGNKRKWKGVNLLLQPYARHCFAKNVYRVDLRKYRNHAPMSTKSSMPSTYRHIRYSENRRNIYDQQYAKYGLSRMTMRSGMWRGQNSPSTTRLRRKRAQYNAAARAVNNRTWNQYNTQASSKRSK